jgi:serine-type D-Ala-D-Ala carboxypeptidase/endopeptidase (penicillin-binding protein 4)
MRRAWPALGIAVAACATGRAAVRSRPVPAVASLARAIDSLVSDARFRNAEWGILVVEPDRGDTLYSRNAGKLFMPASNQKILTGTVALHLLGPEFRFSTTVGTTAAPADGVINGDLVVFGMGDPSISDHMRGDAMAGMREMADSLASRGIVRITGDLATGIDAFPDASLGYGWDWDDLDAAYGAGVDELYFNEGFTRVVAYGGTAAGDPAIVTTAPAHTYPRVHSSVVTAPPDSSRQNQLRVTQDSTDPGAIIASGKVAPRDSATATITYRDNVAAFLTALREALTERGIAVDGNVRSRVRERTVPAPVADSMGSGDMPAMRAPTAGEAYPLFSVLSPPLREILPPLLKPSQNQIAEILLKTLGRSVAGVGRADSGAAVVGRQLFEWGAAPDGFVIRDGSGLSRHDLVTPETIVRALAAIRRDTAFATFYDALPVAGVDGTIATRMRGTAAEGVVHAKTGSLDMVRSLSGYTTTADGHPLIFSVLSNNWTVPPTQVTAVQDSIAARLTRMRLGHP